LGGATKREGELPENVEKRGKNLRKRKTPVLACYS